MKFTDYILVWYGKNEKEEKLQFKWGLWRRNAEE